jgi:TorA maturation chaperone TorD
MEPALDFRSGMDAEAAPPPGVADDDAVRANTYGLLGALLAAPPCREHFDLLANIDIPSTDGLGAAWNVLRRAAERADVEAVDDEYHDLFVGVGRGELIPYCSWYLTGFVMDKPLAVLRSDLAALGFERQDDVKEPEDHAAALLETMALIAAAPEHGIDVQRRFFDRHVATWMRTFFADLQTADSARFYRAVGQFGDQFMAFEMQYLSIVV